MRLWYLTVKCRFKCKMHETVTLLPCTCHTRLKKINTICLCTGYKYEVTGPIPIWPGETARVDFKLIFDPNHETDTDPNNEAHLIPTDVTQRYTYGHPDCSGIEGKCVSSFIWFLGYYSLSS